MGDMMGALIDSIEGAVPAMWGNHLAKLLSLFACQT